MRNRIAIADLEVGQLVHLQSFTLFDAMSAIEIMDPKMDTGMILEGDKKKPFDPLKSLSAEQVLWIMDRLLSCEVIRLDKKLSVISLEYLTIALQRWHGCPVILSHKLYLPACTFMMCFP